jgi:hypothetical protein
MASTMTGVWDDCNERRADLAPWPLLSVSARNQAAFVSVRVADGEGVQRISRDAAIATHAVAARGPDIRVIDRHNAPLAEVAAAVAAVFADQPTVGVDQAAGEPRDVDHAALGVDASRVDARIRAGLALVATRTGITETRHRLHRRKRATAQGEVRIGGRQPAAPTTGARQKGAIRVASTLPEETVRGVAAVMSAVAFVHRGEDAVAVAADA